jgi:HEAT repeat protein
MTLRIIALGIASLVLFAALARSADKEAEVAKYVKDLKSASAKTRATAAQEIGKIGEVKASYAKPALQPLIDVLTDKDAAVRQAAATALAQIDEPKEVVPALEKLLKEDKEQRVRAAAALGLGLMGEASKEALPTLRKVGQEARGKGKDAQPLAQACNRAIQQITGRTKQQ